LEVGLTQCLQQLQKTNPNLLLTTAELRKAECDARYVPAVSLAVATILSTSKIIADETIIARIHSWDTSNTIRSNMMPSNASIYTNTALSHNVQALSSSIERRLRLVLANSIKNTGTRHLKDSNVDEKENGQSCRASISPAVGDSPRGSINKNIPADDKDCFDDQFDVWM
jgi:hypothetical protein